MSKDLNNISVSIEKLSSLFFDVCSQLTIKTAQYDDDESEEETDLGSYLSNLCTKFYARFSEKQAYAIGEVSDPIQTALIHKSRALAILIRYLMEIYENKVPNKSCSAITANQILEIIDDAVNLNSSDAEDASVTDLFDLCNKLIDALRQTLKFDQDLSDDIVKKTKVDNNLISTFEGLINTVNSNAVKSATDVKSLLSSIKCNHYEDYGSEAASEVINQDIIADFSNKSGDEEGVNGFRAGIAPQNIINGINNFVDAVNNRCESIVRRLLNKQYDSYDESFIARQHKVGMQTLELAQKSLPYVAIIDMIVLTRPGASTRRVRKDAIIPNLDRAKALEDERSKIYEELLQLQVSSSTDPKILQKQKRLMDSIKTRDEAIEKILGPEISASNILDWLEDKFEIYNEIYSRLQIINNTINQTNSKYGLPEFNLRQETENFILHNSLENKTNKEVLEFVVPLYYKDALKLLNSSETRFRMGEWTNAAKASGTVAINGTAMSKLKEILSDHKELFDDVLNYQQMYIDCRVKRFKPLWEYGESVMRRGQTNKTFLSSIVELTKFINNRLSGDLMPPKNEIIESIQSRISTIKSLDNKVKVESIDAHESMLEGRRSLRAETKQMASGSGTEAAMAIINLLKFEPFYSSTCGNIIKIITENCDLIILSFIESNRNYIKLLASSDPRSTKKDIRDAISAIMSEIFTPLPESKILPEPLKNKITPYLIRFSLIKQIQDEMSVLKTSASSNNKKLFESEFQELTEDADRAEHFKKLISAPHPDGVGSSVPGTLLSSLTAFKDTFKKVQDAMSSTSTQSPLASSTLSTSITPIVNLSAIDTFINQFKSSKKTMGDYRKLMGIIKGMRSQYASNPEVLSQIDDKIKDIIIEFINLYPAKFESIHNIEIIKKEHLNSSAIVKACEDKIEKINEEINDML